MQLIPIVPPRDLVESAPLSSLVTPEMLATACWTGHWGSDDAYYVRSASAGRVQWFRVGDSPATETTTSAALLDAAGAHALVNDEDRGMLMVGRVYVQLSGMRGGNTSINVRALGRRTQTPRGGMR